MVNAHADNYLRNLNPPRRRKGLATIKASDEGLRTIDRARKCKGWAKSADVWCDLAFTTKATLKRFWRQKRICADSFSGICAAVGVEDWTAIAELTDE